VNLKKFKAAMLARRSAIEEAIDTDFGHRSRHETALMEIVGVVQGIDYLARNLRRFMRPSRRRIALDMRFGSNRIAYQPLGVVGVIGGDDADRRKVLDRTTSGNVTINGTIMHVAQDDLPFGGVGASGIFAARDRRNLVWVTRSGLTTPLPGPALEITNNSFELAPDDGRVLISTVGPDFRADVVVRDLATGTDTLVPPPRQAGAMTSGASVSWAPGGRLFFGVGGVETSEIYDWPADGSTGGRRLVAGLNARMMADGKKIYFTRDEKGANRLRRATLGPNGTAEESEALFPADAEPIVPWFDVSPDGQLLAFTDRGRTDGPNIFVTTLPDPRERRQITSNGGSRPRFSSDGRSLWYFSPTSQAGAARGQINVVPVTTAPFAVGVPSVVLVEDPSNGTSFTSFDVAKGNRFRPRVLTHTDTHQRNLHQRLHATTKCIEVSL
jgi:hypothetical protein